MDLLATAVLAAALHGLFGVTLSAADLAHVGASPREAAWGTGSWTLAVRGGRWTLRQSRGLYGNAVDRGTVSGEGRFVVRLVDGFPHNEDLGRMSWRESAAGLVFVPVVRARNQDIAQILSARPWRRLRSADPIVIRLSGSSTARSTSACFLLIEQGALSSCLTFSGRPGPNAVVQERGTISLALRGGTLRARVRIVQRFGADGTRATQTLTGTLTGGTGPYRLAQGTIAGGGQLVESPPAHVASSSLRYVISLR